MSSVESFDLGWPGLEWKPFLSHTKAATWISGRRQYGTVRYKSPLLVGVSRFFGHVGMGYWWDQFLKLNITIKWPPVTSRVITASWNVAEDKGSKVRANYQFELECFILFWKVFSHWVINGCIPCQKSLWKLFPLKWYQ